MKKEIKSILLILIILSFPIFFVSCSSANNYIVTFDSDGGSQVSYLEVKKDELVERPTNPTKDGFTFIGWYYEDEEWLFEENKVTQNITLTAKWEKIVLLTVTFDSDGGSQVPYLEVKKDELVEKPTNPIKEDFNFVGWYYEDKEWLFEENKVTQNITLTAKWEHSFLLIDENGVLTGVTDYGKTLKKINLPSCLSSIKYKAFDGCINLKELVINQNLKTIELGALYGCSALENLTIPFVGNCLLENLYDESLLDTYKYLFGYIFGIENYDDSIPTKQLYYNLDSYESIEAIFYIPSKLTSVTITGGYVYSGTFLNCANLTTISILDGVRSVDNYAFEGCNNLQYNTFDNVKYLGNSENPYFALIKSNSDSIESCLIHNDTKIISDSAFFECSSLTSITLPNGVTNIGNYAFCDCSSLESITLPNSITSIGESAFYNCSSLTNISIPNSVTSIEDFTFCGCSNLSSVTIPNSVTSIGIYAFCACSSLESIALPNSITSIGENAFSYCDNLQYNTYENANYIGSSENPYLILVEVTLKSITSFSINSNTISIESYAFSDCSNLTSITIPNSVKNIGEFAFYNCSSLTSITIPNNITDIKYGAFSGCSSLTSITLPNNIKSIESNAFSDCSSLQSIVIPNSVTSIGDNAFYGCSNLQSITISNSLKKIGSDAFYGCSSLQSITIPNGVECIEKNTFYGCSSLTSITLPNTITSIKDNAFSECSSLQSIIIPNGVTSIESYAFTHCTSLKTISIPNSITHLGKDIFYYCTNLQSNIYDNAEYLGNTENPYLILLTVTSRSITSCLIHSNTKFILDYAFYGCDSLTSITIPNGITTIRDCTFYCCSKLTTVILPDSLTVIENEVFEGCSSLTNINIPNKVISIGYDAFYECTSLQNLIIPNSVTSIGNRAFYGCTSLQSINIPDNITIIRYETFRNCSNLESVTISDNVTVIDQFAFKDCIKLTTVNIPNNIKSISISAFSNCSSLENISIPNGIESIEDNVFYGCTNLKYNIYENAKYLGNEENPYLILVEVDSKSITSCKIHTNTKIITEYVFYNCNSLETIIFENADGWRIAETPAFNNPIDISSSDLLDSNTAITYLTSTYYYYYWKRG